MPARFVVHANQLQKYACGACKYGVTTAAGPTTIPDQRSADASLLAPVVVIKYADHTPLTRLAGIYECSGATIAVSKMADWLAAVADQVAPIVQVLAGRVAESATKTSGSPVPPYRAREADGRSDGDTTQLCLWCGGLQDRSSIRIACAVQGYGLRHRVLLHEAHPHSVSTATDEISQPSRMIASNV